MRIRTAVSSLATAAIIASAWMAPAQAAARRHHVSHGGPHLSLRYASPLTGHGRSRSAGFVTLVGDRESGLGFYALPRQYRGYGRVRDRQGDAIRYAVGTEMGTAYYGVGGGDAVYGDRHHHAMFNPVDGYGTPFFAGYYGPAGDPDEDRGPFGRPYD